MEGDQAASVHVSTVLYDHVAGQRLSSSAAHLKVALKTIGPDSPDQEAVEVFLVQNKGRRMRRSRRSAWPAKAWTAEAARGFATLALGIE